jgi:pimeloyl-ACP methyl ester carboxylesterase
MDRRGFGASGDAAGYDPEREFEDVAAVVEAVAGHAGEPVALFGHSYGAGCAMGAAALTGAVPRLVLYEPGLGISYPSGSIEEIEAAVAAGDLDTAALLVLEGIVGLTEEEAAALRSGPRWPGLLACTPTVPRECRAEDGWDYRPGRLDRITARPRSCSPGRRPRPTSRRRPTGPRRRSEAPGSRCWRAMPTSRIGPTRPWSWPRSGGSSCDPPQRLSRCQRWTARGTKTARMARATPPP